METPTIYVTEEVCASCPFYYHEQYDKSTLHETLAALLRHHMVPECVLVAIARYKQAPCQEGITCCAAFYHKYGKHIYPITAAQQAGNIKYFSTRDYESLEASKLLLYETENSLYHETHIEEDADAFAEFYRTLDTVRKESA